MSVNRYREGLWRLIPPSVFCSCENNSEHLAISCHRLPGNRSPPHREIAIIVTEDRKGYNFDESLNRADRYARDISKSICDDKNILD